MTNEVVTTGGDAAPANPATARWRGLQGNLKTRLWLRLNAIGKLSNTTAFKLTLVYLTVFALFAAFLLGYFFFNELPTVYVFVGAAIITAAGLFVIWRERQLGLQRQRAAEGPPTGA